MSAPAVKQLTIAGMPKQAAGLAGQSGTTTGTRTKPRARRWVDYSDEENSRDLIIGTGALTSEDSYQGPTVSLFDDSKDGLNLAFKGAAAIDGQPSKRVKRTTETAEDVQNKDEKRTDFGFMFKDTRKAVDHLDTEKRGGDAAPAGTRNAQQGKEGRALSMAKKAEEGEKENVEGQLNPFAPDFIPTLCPEFRPVAVLQVVSNDAATKTAGPGSAVGKHRAMPEATEEEWQHRELRRTKDVDREKSHKDYAQYLTLVPKESRGAFEPRTPDPKDRNISKRDWKRAVETWKVNIRTRVGRSRCNSTISDMESVLEFSPHRGSASDASS